MKSTEGYTDDESAGFDKIGGLVNIYPSTKPLLIKRHFPEEADRLILLVRNYKEAIIRHQDGKVELNPQFLLGNILNYYELLRFYDDFNGSKILFYYEDLISDPEKIIRKALEFLDETTHEQRIGEFFPYLQYHKNTCINVYAQHGKSYTKGEHDIFHSAKISKTKIRKWDAFMREQDPDLFDKYLNRYVVK